MTTAPMLRVRAGIWTDAAQWNAYVDSMPGASNYHRWMWRAAIQDTYGHEPVYLAATEGSRIQGILPLYLMRSRLFGDFLVSLPFFSYAGLLASTPQAATALLDEAARIACETGVSHIELRHGDRPRDGWVTAKTKLLMEVDLPPSPEELWDSLSSRTRNKIRNARKHGFGIQWGGLDQVRHFFPVFAANMRNLGTPTYPCSWFENLCRNAPNHTRIVTLWDRGKAVAGAFLTPFRETVEAPWIASLPEARKQYSTVLLYWTFLEWATANGYKVFDLGRCTRGDGTYQFKTQWRCRERLVDWHYWLAPGSPPPELRAGNPKFRMAVAAWKHMPLWLANRLGPRLIRSIP